MEKNIVFVNELEKMGQTLAECGLVESAEGNISLRAPDGTVYISARGSQLGMLRDEDVTLILPDGSVPDGEKTPTSEFEIHMGMYHTYPDVNVVLHTHSVFATVVAINGESIPPVIDEMTILIGGEVKVAEYAAPGTKQLAENAIKAMGDRKAVLLANHGAVIIGESSSDALKIARLVEKSAKVFTFARMGGVVKTIPSVVLENQKKIYDKKRSMK